MKTSAKHLGLAVEP